MREEKGLRLRGRSTVHLKKRKKAEEKETGMEKSIRCPAKVCTLELNRTKSLKDLEELKYQGASRLFQGKTY